MAAAAAPAAVQPFKELNETAPHRPPRPARFTVAPGNNSKGDGGGVGVGSGSTGSRES